MCSQHPCDVDVTILGDPANEEGRPIDYYVNATAFLANHLWEDGGLKRTSLYQRVMRLVEYWCAPASMRSQDVIEDAVIDLHLFGTIGKALFHATATSSPGLRRELKRFAEDRNQMIGNFYLFHIAATLSASKYDVDFITEESRTGTKTPDLRASKGSNVIFIEANAKQPTKTVATPQQLRDLIHTIIVEKQQKFTEARFSPGMIVADISSTYHLSNETGLPSVLKLRKDLIRPLDGGRFLYRLYEDPDWRAQPYNQGNVFAYLIEEFAAIDRNRYNVQQCMVSLSRDVLCDGDTIAFPKGSLLVVRRDAEERAIVELAKAVYVIE